MAQQERSYDIGIIGASGFTGNLVMERLGKVGAGLKILASSRHPDRLAKLIGDMGSSIKAWPRSVDSKVYNSLVEFVSQAKVIIACAGPFYDVGIPVVKACVETGTHYVDITGEVDFMRHIIDVFDEQARIKNTFVISACGFDSVPSDMGVFCLQKVAPSPVLRATSYVVMKGSYSGGTLRTLFSTGKDSSRTAIISDAYALNDRLDDVAAPGKLPSKFEMDPRGISYDHDLKKWLSPLVMATINTRVVRRTVSLNRVHPNRHLNFHRDFMYREVSQSSSLLSALLPTVISLALSPFKWVFSWSVFQGVLSWLVPAAGAQGGPSKDQRQHNFARYLIVGACQNNEKVEVQFYSKDPYEATSETVSQAALCILQNEQDLLREHNGGGVFTPAYALGEKFLSRLSSSDLVKFSSTEGV